MTTSPHRAIVYTRISLDKAGQGLGVERQEADCRDLANREGLAVVDVHSDNDTSAYSGKARPGFEAALDALATGHASHLITYRVDRLYRRMRELVRVVEIVEDVGARIHTVASGDIDLSTAAGRMSVQVMASVAEHESASISERVTRWHRQQREAGRYSGGRRPYGYESNGTTIRESEAAALREAAARVLAGESCHGITQDWAGRPSIPPRSGGKPWGVDGGATSLRTALRSPRLAGLRVHDGLPVGDAEWPAILDRTTWSAVSTRLASKRTQRPPRTYPLTGGLLVCGRCGEPLKATPRTKAKGKTQRVYGCRSTGNERACGRMGALADELESTTLELIIMRGDFTAAARESMAGRSEEAQAASVGLAKVRADLAIMDDMRAADELDLLEWRRLRLPLTEQRRDLEAVMSRAAASGNALALLSAEIEEASLVRGWPGLPTQTARAKLDAMIQRVILAPHDRARGSAFQHDRVSVILHQPTHARSDAMVEVSGAGRTVRFRPGAWPPVESYPEDWLPS